MVLSSINMFGSWDMHWYRSLFFLNSIVIVSSNLSVGSLFLLALPKIMYSIPDRLQVTDFHHFLWGWANNLSPNLEVTGDRSVQQAALLTPTVLTLSLPPYLPLTRHLSRCWSYTQTFHKLWPNLALVDKDSKKVVMDKVGWDLSEGLIR